MENDQSIIINKKNVKSFLKKQLSKRIWVLFFIVNLPMSPKIAFLSPFGF